MAEFRALLSKHVGSAFARQLAFADHLGERNWNLDVQKGIATFGTDMKHPIQLLGTEADGDSTWLWAWANEQSGLPEKILVACNQIRQLGTDQRIAEFQERSFSLDRADGHRLSLLASGIIGQCCYYRGPYDGGALFFLVNDVAPAVLKPVDAERAIRVVTEVISQFEVDHRVMVESFLQSQGFSIEHSAEGIVAARNGDSINIAYDSAGRISEIGGKINPRQSTSEKKWWEFWK
jgi:hypothetical protein